MNTNGWNRTDDREDLRHPNSASYGAAISLGTVDAMLCLSLALTVLFLLPGAGYAVEGATGSPGKPADTYDLPALPNSLATSDEQPVADELMRRLWRNRLAAPKPDNELQGRAALAELIRKVRWVQREIESPIIPAAPSEPANVNPPAQVPAEPQPAAEPTIPAAAPVPVSVEEAMPSGTMEALRPLLADPNQASDPAEIAELLFLSGRPQEAAILYRKALEVATRSGPAAKEDRAWLLLQLGNCLRETDPTQAQAMYAALAAEYPNCPWAELARAQSQFLTWSQTARPQQWISPAKGQEVPDEPPGRMSLP
jgi:tetratricopeptide (TPR) repeat protein